MVEFFVFLEAHWSVISFFGVQIFAVGIWLIRQHRLLVEHQISIGALTKRQLVHDAKFEELHEKQMQLTLEQQRLTAQQMEVIKKVDETASTQQRILLEFLQAHLKS